MKNESVAAPERVIAAVIFLLAGIAALVLAGVVGKVSFWAVLELLAFLAAAVALFSKDREKFGAIGFGILALVILLLFLRALFTHGYSNAIYNYSYRRGTTVDYKFNFLAFLGGIARVSAFLFLAMLAYNNFMKNDSSLNHRWYMPALLLGVCIVLTLLSSIRGGFLRNAGSVSALSSPLLIVAFLFAALWITGQEPEGYFSVARHLALTVFTLGLWYIAWVWHSTRHLNKVENFEERKPTACLLLCLFLPFYALYWNYGSAQRVDRLAGQNGVASKLDVLCLALGLIFPFLPSILIQDKFNRIALVQSGKMQPDFALAEQASAPASAPQPAPILDETPAEA